MTSVTVKRIPVPAPPAGRGSGASPEVALVTLCDPERRNMLSGPMVTELVAAFDELEADERVGVIIVTGAPPAFCAGADLGGLASASAAGAGGSARAAGAGGPETGLRSIYEGFLRVSRCSLPTIAAVNGAAVGAGMNLALACDVRVVARGARFDCRFLELGLHPGGGHTWMLDRLVGAEVARAMVLFGRILDGEAAAAHGLAWEVVDDDALREAAISLAAGAAAGPRPLAIRVKETLTSIAGVADHPAAVDAELVAQMWSLGQPFFGERLAAIRARISKRA
jgi:enoyl-CoA hydratase